MKKSEISVSMPMTAYEELVAYKEKFYAQRERLRGLFTIGADNVLTFACKKAAEMAKETLPQAERQLIIELEI